MGVASVAVFQVEIHRRCRSHEGGVVGVASIASVAAFHGIDKCIEVMYSDLKYCIVLQDIAREKTNGTLVNLGRSG